MPPGALEQLDNLIGARVETMSILGTQQGASGGTYLSDVNDTAVDVAKLTGRGDIGDPKPIGDSGVGWNLLFEGGIGYATFTNRFRENELAGNESQVGHLRHEPGRRRPVHVPRAPEPRPDLRGHLLRHVERVHRQH